MGHDPVYEALITALNELREHKPDDRSPRDRRIAVTITMMEKVVAYYYTYVIVNLGERV